MGRLKKFHEFRFSLFPLRGLTMRRTTANRVISGLALEMCCGLGGGEDGCDGERKFLNPIFLQPVEFTDRGYGYRHLTIMF